MSVENNKKYYGWKGFFPLLTFLAIYLGGGLVFTALDTAVTPSSRSPVSLRW